MKTKNLMKWLSVLMMFFMITGLTNAVTIPNGDGIQRIDTGNSTGEPMFIKGVFFHVIIGEWGTQYIKVGDWLTLSVGVLTGIDSMDNLDEALVEIKEFMDGSTWQIFLDDVDLTEAFLDSGLYDNPWITTWIDEDTGDTWYQVIVRYNLYIVPQAKGCYPFYGSVGNGEITWIERYADLCWMAASFFK